MSEITLYQAQAEMQQRIQLATNEDGEIDMERVNSIECAFHDRAVAYIAVSRTLHHRAAALRAQRDAVNAEYDKRIKSIEANEQRLTDSLKAAMRATGSKKIESDDGLLYARLDVDAVESVELDENVKFPQSLCNPVKDPTPSKTLIKAAIERGEPVAGARIVRKDRFTWR